MRNIGAYGSFNNFKMMGDFKKWIDKNDLSKEMKTSGILGVVLDNPKYEALEECQYDVIFFVPINIIYTSEVEVGQFKGGK